MASEQIRPGKTLMSQGAGTCAQEKKSLIVKSMGAGESSSRVGKERAVLVWSIGSVICGGDAVGGRPDGLDQLPETFTCVRDAYELLFFLVLFTHSIFLCKSFQTIKAK